MENNELIKQAKKGNKDALAQIIILNKSDYYKIAYSFTFCKNDALDAISDMTLILFKKIHSLKDIEKFDQYSKTILVNCCRKILKFKKRVVATEQDIFENIEGRLSNNDEVIILKEMIQKLPIKQKEVIIFKYFLDYDYQCISETLNVPIGTVKSRLNKAIISLKELIGGSHNE